MGEMIFEEEDPRSLLKPNKVLGLMSKTLIVDGVPKVGEDSAQLNAEMDAFISEHAASILMDFHKKYRHRVNNLSVAWS